MKPENDIRIRLRPGCICKGIRLHTIIEAIAQGANTPEKVKKATGIGDGSCKGKRCGEKVERLLREKLSLPG